ncbi:MAG: hypothetical protein WC663_01025 [Patescibacteria group bacterium]
MVKVLSFKEIEELFKKSDKSELEYFLAIEALGGEYFYVYRESDYKEETDQSRILKRAMAMLDTMARELAQFGVIHPNDCPERQIGKKLPDAPEGKKWYWHWFYDMREVYYRELYNRLLCPACPFDKGFLGFRYNHRNFPCNHFRAFRQIASMADDVLCGVMHYQKVPIEMLLVDIFRISNRELTRAFLRRISDLVHDDTPERAIEILLDETEARAKRGIYGQC